MSDSMLDKQKWIKTCPECNEEQSYSRKDGMVRAKKRNTLCFKCKGKNISKSLIGRVSTMKGRRFSKEHKDKISKALTGIIRSEETKKKISISRTGKKLSIESRTKRRLKRLKDLQCIGGKFNPCYNVEACNFFDKLEKEKGWNGFYATKTGEYFIDFLGYWLDYYEPTQNIVIEWDEKHHYIGGKLRSRDIKRQEEIIHCLNCSFYRINKLTNEKMMIDCISGDNKQLIIT